MRYRHHDGHPLYVAIEVRSYLHPYSRKGLTVSSPLGGLLYSLVPARVVSMIVERSSRLNEASLLVVPEGCPGQLDEIHTVITD